MDEECSIDNDLLISLVHARPVLWDQTLDIYKDRVATREAWTEVYCSLKENYEELSPMEKNTFGRGVMKRWANLRDAYLKAKRKLEEKRRSGARHVKKYVYADQLQFLNKLYHPKEATDSVDGDSVDVQVPSVCEESFENTLVEASVVTEDLQEDTIRERKRLRFDQVGQKSFKLSEEPSSSAHMYFFQGLLPHLHNLNDSEVLEFQMGVLQIISKLYEKKNTPRTSRYRQCGLSSTASSSENCPSSSL